MKRALAALSIVGIAVASVPAAAHHSAVMFDRDSVIEVTGTIKEIQWTNPHAWIHVDTVAEGGESQLWSFETEGPNILTRAGITRKRLQVGDVVIVKGNPLKDGRPAAILVSIEKEDGSVLSLRPNLRRPPQ